MRVNDAIERYLIDITINRGMANATIEGYQSDLRQYAAFLAERGLCDMIDIDADAIYDFISESLERKSKSSVARLISSIRSFHRFAAVEDASLKDPTLNIRTVKKRRYLPRYLSVDDLDKLFDSFDSSPRDLYHKALLELLYACGLRVSELCNLKINQYNRANGFIRIVGKGNKERLVPIAKTSATLLDTYIDTVRDHWNKKSLSNVFVNRLGNRCTRQYVGNMLKSKEKELGLRLELSPHSLRHTFATDLLANNADLRVVQELLGHSDISTTQIYTHVQEDHLHRAYDKFHPGNKRGNNK